MIAISIALSWAPPRCACLPFLSELCFFTSFETASNTAATSGDDSPRIRIITGNLDTACEQKLDHNDVKAHISLSSTKYSNRQRLGTRTGALGSGLRERETVTLPLPVACGSEHEIKLGVRKNCVQL